MRINHNITALYTLNNFKRSNKEIHTSMSKLSSGLQINSAKDDASGLAVSEKMRAQIRGLTRAHRNVQEGINLISIAEGGLGEMHNVLQRMRELAVQSGNGTYSSEDRSALQNELTELTEEVDHIANSTEFNTIPLLNGLGSNRVESIGETDKGDTGEGIDAAKYFDPPPEGSHLGIQNIRLSPNTRLEAGTYTLEVNPRLQHTTGLEEDIWHGYYPADDIKISNMDFFGVGKHGLITYTNPEVHKFDSSGSITDVKGYPPSFPDVGFVHEDPTRGKYEIGNNFQIEVKGSQDDRVITIYDDEMNKIAEETGLSDNAANNGLMISPISDAYGSFKITAATLSSTNGIPATFDTKDSDWKLAYVDPYTREIDYSYPPLDFAEFENQFNLWDVATIKTTHPTYNLITSFEIWGDYTADFKDSDGNYIVKEEPLPFNGENKVLGNDWRAEIDWSTGIMFNTDSNLSGGTMEFKIADPLENEEEPENDSENKNRQESEFILQVGPNSGNQFHVEIRDMRVNALGISKDIDNSSNTVISSDGTIANLVSVDSEINFSLDISSSRDAASKAIDIIDDAIQGVSNERSRLGSYDRSLQHITNNLNNYESNLTAAESRIRDVDYDLAAA